MSLKEKIYTISDPEGKEWEVKVFSDDDPNVEVRCKGTSEWKEAVWGIFCKNHGIDHGILA